MKCRACQSDIEEGATKCVHCDSYQDWRRHFGVGTVVLTLVGALLSVVVTLRDMIPSPSELFQAPRADLQFELLKCENYRVHVWVKNSGDLETAVSGGQVQAERNGRLGEALPLMPGEDGEARIVAPDASDEFWLHLDTESQLLPRKKKEHEACRYRVELTEKSLSGDAGEALVEYCDCPLRKEG